MIVIELKKSINLTLLLQAVDRQKISDSVYVAVPAPKGGRRNKKQRRIEALLKRLELGLILVYVNSIAPHAQLIFHPIEYDKKRSSSKKRAILRETKGRHKNVNVGGSTRKKTMTAYRERLIFAACALERLGASRPATLKKLGIGDKAGEILYNNHYKWFDRIDRGIYELTQTGQQGLEEFPEMTKLYREIVKGWEVEVSDE